MSFEQFVIDTSMRKKSILCLSVVAVIVIIIMLSCNVAVNSNSAGRTFDSAREVPKTSSTKIRSSLYHRSGTTKGEYTLPTI